MTLISPISFLNDKPVAWLASLPTGELVVISEKLIRIHEGRPECPLLKSS
jgi:hypothetical protein